MLTGENGILTQAQNAKEETTKSEEEEKIKMAVMGSSINDDGFVEMIDETSFKNELKNQFGNQKLDVVVNGDGSFIITVEDTQRKYYVNDDKTVINSDNIIEIGTADELMSFRDDVNNGNSYEGKAVLLTSDIALSGEWIPIGYYPMSNSSPADETNKPFKGIFDGCGHEVDNFTINTTDKVQGLFGLVDNAKIANLGIGENASVNAGTGTAGVVGYIYNGTTVYNCYNKASIKGTNPHTGGIIGISFESNKVSKCYNLGKVEGTTRVGGIVGYLNDSSIISNCFNEGSTIGNDNVGGIAGCIGVNCAVKNCYNAGIITASNTVGGVVGTSAFYNSKIEKCFNSGNVEATGENEYGNSNVGGIIGIHTGGDALNCYNTGTVTGQYRYFGGIIGLNRGTLENSYNIGNVSEPVDTIGAIVGNNNEFYYDVTDITYIGETHNCYSLEGVTSKLFGVNSSIVGSECSFKTSDELKNLYEVLGNDFKEDIEGINNGYPILEWQ